MKFVCAQIHVNSFRRSRLFLSSRLKLSLIGSPASFPIPALQLASAQSNQVRYATFESIDITVLSSKDHSPPLFRLNFNRYFIGFNIVWERNVSVSFTSFVVVVVVVVAVKEVVLKSKSLLTKDKILVSITAGIKLKEFR
ncbi:unnamed protein product [Vicia faba]|uniref:Uncharacterized protein n=1 Tax=Vicia faba TaxID=3906 RepID=A0AAV0ZV10_VICFA|nr:unnamed protein product [Vicia faba]